MLLQLTSMLFKVTSAENGFLHTPVYNSKKVEAASLNYLLPSDKKWNQGKKELSHQNQSNRQKIGN